MHWFVGHTKIGKSGRNSTVTYLLTNQQEKVIFTVSK